MVDFSHITDRLYTGAGIESTADIEQLLAVGITHIIDARQEFNDQELLYTFPQLHYAWVPTADDGVHPKPVGWFQKALDFAIPALAQPGNIVFTHCAAGINRGPSLCYAILRVQGFSSAFARDIIHAGRPIAGIAYADDADLALQQLGWVK